MLLGDDVRKTQGLPSLLDQVIGANEAQIIGTESEAKRKLTTRLRKIKADKEPTQQEGEDVNFLEDDELESSTCMPEFRKNHETWQEDPGHMEAIKETNRRRNHPIPC